MPFLSTYLSKKALDLIASIGVGGGANVGGVAREIPGQAISTLDYLSGGAAQIPARLTALGLSTAGFNSPQPKPMKFSDMANKASGNVPYFSPTLGVVAGAIGDPLNLIGGGEVKGVKGILKLLRATKDTARGISDASKIARGAGFETKIIEQYAPLWAKAKTVEDTKKVTEAAVKLQNTTRAYEPVLNATTKISKDPLNAQGFKTADAFISAYRKDKVFHGTDFNVGSNGAGANPILKYGLGRRAGKKSFDKPIFFTKNRRYAKVYGRNIFEYKIPKDTKVLDVLDKKSATDFLNKSKRAGLDVKKAENIISDAKDLYKGGHDTWSMLENKSVLDYIKASGYDALKMVENRKGELINSSGDVFKRDITSFAILNKKDIPVTVSKTRKELTDIFNKAKVTFKQTQSIVPVRGKDFILGTQTKAKELTRKAFIKQQKTSLKLEQKQIKLDTKAKELQVKQTTKKENAFSRVFRAHGNTDRIISVLKKGNARNTPLTSNELKSVTLENGTRLTDTVAVKRTKDGTLSAVITKQDIKDVKSSYIGKKVKPKWEHVNALKSLLSATPREARRLYYLPYTYLERIGLKDILFKPVREAERASQDLKTTIYNDFKKAGLFKTGGAFTADSFKLSKADKSSITKYYLEIQGKKTGVTLKDLSQRSRKTVELFDKIKKELQPDIFRVAKQVGKPIGEIPNYSPLMTRADMKLAGEQKLPDFISQIHPSLFSLKERVKNVPIKMYEPDYTKVMTRWINSVSDFIHIGDVVPQLKYLINTKDFKETINPIDYEYITKWLQDITTPRNLSGLDKGIAVVRKATAFKSLGLNLLSVAKQVLTQIPLTIIEKAPPKFSSKFAKDFGIKVSDLASIKERKGNVSIADLQEGYARAIVGQLTEFDKFNATLSLNRLLDKSYKEYKGKGLPITQEVQNKIVNEASDTLDMWYGGMTKSQLPEVFRSEVGKTLNMFIFPLTAQLNGFFLTIAREKGIKQATKVAEVLTAMTAIAYSEQTITNMSFKWSDTKQMVVDVMKSFAGNIPVLSQIVFSIGNNQAFSPSPIVSNADSLRRAFNKYNKSNMSFGILSLHVGEMFGIPAQIRKTSEGIAQINAGGKVNNKGKLLAPLTSGDKIRSFIRGKYGSLTVQDYMRNIGVSKDKRKWFFPQVEFLQNGDYARKAELWKTFDASTKKELLTALSVGQKKLLKKALTSKTKAPITREALKAILLKKLNSGEMTQQEAKRKMSVYDSRYK